MKGTIGVRRSVVGLFIAPVFEIKLGKTQFVEGREEEGGGERSVCWL